MEHGVLAQPRVVVELNPEVEHAHLEMLVVHNVLVLSLKLGRAVVQSVS